MSSLLVEIFDRVKDYIILDLLLDYLKDNVEEEEIGLVFKFLIANKFYEKVKFYAVNDFCHVMELDDQANQYVKYYLIDWYNEYSLNSKPLDDEQRQFLESYRDSFNEIIDICVSAEELKKLPFLEGKINYDELVTDHADDLLDKELMQPLTIHDFKIKLSKEQVENYRLRQENRQFHESLSKFYPQHNDSEQQSPSFLPAPLPYDELLAEKERLVTEVWKLLEQRDTATELLKTEQQEKNLLKEENAQLHAKIAELSAQHNQTGESLTDNNKELPHNSQMGVARLIYTLLSELKFDFNSHKGKENEVIVQASEVLGVSVSPNFVAKWIKLAREAKNDK